MAQITLSELQKALDKGFKDQDTRMGKRFDAQDLKIQKGFETQDGKMQKGLDGLARDLKAYIKDQNEELARITKTGFDDVFKRLDVTERVERLEKFRDIVTQALNIRA